MTNVLLMVDVQRNMLLPPEPVPTAETVGPAINAVLELARAAGATVVHIRNNGGTDDPDAPGTEGWELVHEVAAGEHVVDKFQPNSFADTSLAELVPADADVTVVGMQSEFCVIETSLAALHRGNRVRLVRGAHATYPGSTPADAVSAEVERDLRTAGATVVDLAEISF